MSDLGRLIFEDQLKAPAGQFRVVTATKAEKPQHYLVGDFGEKEEAMERWRELIRTMGSRLYKHSVLNEHGQRVGVYGIIITKDECKAPAGKFRLVCIDVGPAIAGKSADATYYLVGDYDEKQKALDYANEENGAPGDCFIGYNVFDDTGDSLIKSGGDDARAPSAA